MKHCLEGGTGAVPQAAKYLVYTLPAESALIGTECEFIMNVIHMCSNSTLCAGVICLEEFAKGSTVARLSCLCSFHNSEFCHCYDLSFECADCHLECLTSWLQRGRSCPVHAR